MEENEEKGGLLLAWRTGKGHGHVSHPRMQVISHTVVDGHWLHCGEVTATATAMQCISSKVNLLFGMEASSVDPFTALISMN